MLTDLEITLLVALVGALSWLYVAVAHGLHYPVRAVVMFILSMGLLAVSVLAVDGSSLTLVAAAFNRAFVASIGLLLAYRLTRRRWESRRRAGRNDP